MKTITIILLAFIFTACSSPQSKPIKTHKQTLAEKKAAPKKNYKKQAPKKITKLDGKYNIDELIKKTLSTDWEKSRWFETIDNKNGYARMGAFMEGSYDYFLFVGDEKQLLIQVTWGCGPACEQVVHFYSIRKGKVSDIEFSKIVSPTVKSRYKDLISACTDEKDFNSWSNSDCNMMFEFPKVGTTTSLYQAKFFEDEKFDGEFLGKLTWNKKAFQFEIKD